MLVRFTKRAPSLPSTTTTRLPVVCHPTTRITTRVPHITRNVVEEPTFLLEKLHELVEGPTSWYQLTSITMEQPLPGSTILEVTVLPATTVTKRRTVLCTTN
ncbi:hypothetical protein EVAR_50259_1 [Eumeta japonica]|uniref:Uncharacterized protein n=1 Tax=Eumeta variegata TaxID=151549 RepID=A0A4C1Y554_EUMVA|nr:hypothetical protein EVAR_50259_1 [Eumeta japonica]